MSALDVFPPSRLRTSLIAVGVLLLAGVATAQPAPDTVPTTPEQVSPLASAAGTLVFYLIVGALLVGIVPDYVDRMTRRIREDTVLSFLWGIGLSVALVILIVILVITIVGILVAIPLILLAALCLMIGNVLVMITIGTLALEELDRRRDLWAALVIGLVIAVLIGLIPIVGPLFNFAIGMIGFGAVVSGFLTNR